MRWPPTPFAKVSFQPPCYWGYDSSSAHLCATPATLPDGWVSDRGDPYEKHGELSYGWRCTPPMSWTGHGRTTSASANRDNCADAHGPDALASCHELADYSDPNQGMVQIPNAYYDFQRNAIQPTCPDGLPNEWEIAVPNGLYMLTVYFTTSGAQPKRPGCHFENVRPVANDPASPQKNIFADPRGMGGHTETFSVEVTDGNFTLGAHSLCSFVNWIRLDILDETSYPLVWLPAPKHEWSQLELEEPTAPIGLVTIKLPNAREVTPDSFPHPDIEANVASFGDCRTWWMYGAAKCQKMLMLGRGPGAQPGLATKPTWPGYNASHLEALFAEWDVDADGVMLLTELQAALPTIWSSSAAFKLFNGLNVDQHLPGGTPDGVTLDELLQGPMSPPALDARQWFAETLARGAWCDPLLDVGPSASSDFSVCMRFTGQGVVPSEWGSFHADGAHGAVVSVSDTPCTDAIGCPSAADETVCALHLVPGGGIASDTDTTGVIEIDCGGAVGRYLRISLPGEHERLMPSATVHAHRARGSSPDPSHL